MNTKTLLAGLVGGVVHFIAGFVIYAKLLHSFMEANMNNCAMLPMDQMNMILMGLSSLCFGLLMAFILSWANVSNLQTGLIKGAIVGILYALWLCLCMHSLSTTYSNTTAMVVDVLAATVMSALVGGVVGWMLGRGNTAAA